MSDFVYPSVDDFKSFFLRDFQYAPANSPNDLSFVTDTDIQNAISGASVNFSPIFGDASTIIFFYLVAHNLVINLRNSSAGLNSQAQFMRDSLNVGSVSLTNNINELFAKDPIFSGLLKTGYGQKYLDLVYPFTVGNVGISCGTTTFA